MVSYITRSGKVTISNLTENTPTSDVKFAATSVREINLNFGTAATVSVLEP